MMEFIGSKEILDMGKENGFTTLRMTFEDKNAVGRTACNVFEISEEEFYKMDDYEDEYSIHFDNEEHPLWKKEWGWYRYAEGCVLERREPTIHANINGNELVVWYDSDAMRDDINDWREEEEYKDEPTQNLMAYWIAEHCNYSDLFSYCSDMWGASTEKNITAIAVGLAKMNKMSLADLFKLTA